MDERKEVKLSKNLNKLIQSNNLKVTVLASKLQINKSTFHNYCNGVTPNSLISLIKISKFFNITLDNLVFENTDYLKSPLSFKKKNEIKYEVSIKEIL